MNHVMFSMSVEHCIASIFMLEILGEALYCYY